MAKIVVGGMKYRDYQKPVVRYFDTGGTRASLIWHRRSGKDRTMLNVAVRMAMKRVGLYWHCLPTHKQAKRVIWDNITKDGQRLMDVTIPLEMRKSTNETELKVTLKNGSIIQLIGADNFDSNIGANPVGITYSEFAVTHPKAWDLMRPILAENGGWAAFVTTPRGYNHAFHMHEALKNEPGAYSSLLTVDDTGVVPVSTIEADRRAGMPEELIRQEYWCDFSAANVGAILGRYMEELEKTDRISHEPVWDPEGGPIHVSSDIGFHDTAAFWFWQQRPHGHFALVDYMEDSGKDAQEWIEVLAATHWNVDTLWLPHDAKAKTFQSKHSVVEQFIRAEWAGQVKIAPAMKDQDKVNASRTVIQRCEFDGAACAKGLLALRDWSFKWDDIRKVFGSSPDHNWASHAADAFCYGAAMIPNAPRKKTDQAPKRAVAAQSFTLNQLFKDHESAAYNRNRLP